RDPRRCHALVLKWRTKDGQVTAGGRERTAVDKTAVPVEDARQLQARTEQVRTPSLELVLDVTRLRAIVIRATRVEGDHVTLEVRIAVRVRVTLGIVVGVRDHTLPVVGHLLLESDLKTLVITLAASQRGNHVVRVRNG